MGPRALCSLAMWLQRVQFPSCHSVGWLAIGSHSALLSPSSPTEDRSELEGSTLSVLSAASAGRQLLPQERLRKVAFEYCQRLIEQSNRRKSPGRHGVLCPRSTPRGGT